MSLWYHAVIYEWERENVLKTIFFFFYKNLVYKNVKASKCPKIKNVVVILLVAISISFEGFEKKMMFL